MWIKVGPLVGDDYKSFLDLLAHVSMEDEWLSSWKKSPTFFSILGICLASLGGIIPWFEERPS